MRSRSSRNSCRRSSETRKVGAGQDRFGDGPAMNPHVVHEGVPVAEFAQASGAYWPDHLDFDRHVVAAPDHGGDFVQPAIHPPVWREVLHEISHLLDQPARRRRAARQNALPRHFAESEHADIVGKNFRLLCEQRIPSRRENFEIVGAIDVEIGIEGRRTSVVDGSDRVRSRGNRDHDRPAEGCNNGTRVRQTGIVVVQADHRPRRRQDALRQY